MENLVSVLTKSEMERIMEVMSRDRRLREREQERVAMLGIDLVREKRRGALVAGSKYKGSSNSRCARCLKPLPTTARLRKSNWRCCICKHLVCKLCRVVKKSNDWEAILASYNFRKQNEVFADQSQHMEEENDAEELIQQSDSWDTDSLNMMSGFSSDASFSDEEDTYTGTAPNSLNETEKTHLHIPLPRQPSSASSSVPEKLENYKKSRREVAESNTIILNDSILSKDSEKVEESKILEDHHLFKETELVPEPASLITHDYDNSLNPFISDDEGCEENTLEDMSIVFDETDKNTNPFLESDNESLVQDEIGKNPFEDDDSDENQELKSTCEEEVIPDFLPNSNSTPQITCSPFEERPTENSPIILSESQKIQPTAKVAQRRPQIRTSTPIRSLRFLTQSPIELFTEMFTPPSDAITKTRDKNTNELNANSAIKKGLVYSLLGGGLRTSLVLTSRDAPAVECCRSDSGSRISNNENQKNLQSSEDDSSSEAQPIINDSEQTSKESMKLLTISGKQGLESERFDQVENSSDILKEENEVSEMFDDEASKSAITTKNSLLLTSLNSSNSTRNETEEINTNLIKEKNLKTTGKMLEETDVETLSENSSVDAEECSSTEESGFSSDLSNASLLHDVSSDAIAGDVDDSDNTFQQISKNLSAIPVERGLYLHPTNKLQVPSAYFQINSRKRKRRRRKSKKQNDEENDGGNNCSVESHSLSSNVSCNDISTADIPPNSVMKCEEEKDYQEFIDDVRVTPDSTTPSKRSRAGSINEQESETMRSNKQLPGLSRKIARSLAKYIWDTREEEVWVCRVCDKTLEFQKKTGDWFRKATTPSAMMQKQLLCKPPVPINRSHSSTRWVDVPNLSPGFKSAYKPSFSDQLKRSNSSASNYSVRHLRHRSVSAEVIMPPASTNEVSLSLPANETSRPRSRTLQPTPSLSFSPHITSSHDRKINKVTVAESLHANLQKYIPEPPSPEGAQPKFIKKTTSKGSSDCIPATIKDGPENSIVARGNPISLCCSLGGTPPLKVVWRKGRDEISHSKQCTIETTRTLSALTILKSERDDSGCYTLQVTNSAGVDQFSVSVHVVDAPDSPGKPFAELSENNIVVSWYGSGYDGGSPIKEYLLEMAKIQDPEVRGRIRWSEVASTNSTSYTVRDAEKNMSYKFRVSARNDYGVSAPGPVSNLLRNEAVVENGTESTDDEHEDDFVKYEPVSLKQNVKFSTKYQIGEKLGQGRFGKVHRVVDRHTGKPYAAKIMRALKAKDREAVSMEIEIMNHLRHPRLVQLIDAYIQEREVTMVMDLVAGGELFERVIDEDFELTEAACIKYMRQICAGVRFMHDSSVVHLDLKPENIMCINKTGTKIKIIDFGLARRYNPSETIRVMFGTPEFVAPEVINYDAIGFQTDMWSVGVICYILLSGLSPFSGDADSETLSNVTAVQWDFEDEAFDQISDDAKDFISHLLVKSLKNRYTVDKALEHKWLKKDTNKMAKSKLDTKNLRKFLARRRWQKTGNAVRALGRLAALAKLSPTSSVSNGQQRESGFLSALKAQLVREKEAEEPEKRKPEFTSTFDDIEVIEGSAAKFQCTIIGIPDPEVIWYQDGKPIKESRHFRISYTDDDVCTLLITEASEADEAEYTCKAVNSEAEVTHSAELIVITPVSNSSLYSRERKFSLNSSISSTSSVFSTERTSLVSSWLKEGDTAVFCFDLYQSLEQKQTKTNKDFSTSSYVPVASWYRCENGYKRGVHQFNRLEPVVTSGRFKITTFTDSKNIDNNLAMSTYFVIYDVKPQDEGIYECVGGDFYGEESITFRLSIITDAMIHQKTFGIVPRFTVTPENQTVSEGQSAELDCTVVAKPNAVVNWYMYGTKLGVGNRHRYDSYSPKASLLLSSTKWYDSGKYEIVAISPLGQVSCSVDLRVEPLEYQEVGFDGSPMFLKRTQSKMLCAGKSIVFHCTVAGVPQPKVCWKRGETLMKGKENSRYNFIATPGGGYSFVIKKSRLSDCGKYTCIAENDRGVALCAAYLFPGDSNVCDNSLNYEIPTLCPVFVTRPHSIAVRQGYSAVFRCTVHGVPKPIVTWYRADGTEIKPNHRYVVEEVHSHYALLIKETGHDDTGSYYCIAKNTTGEVCCSTKLNVQLTKKSAAPVIKWGTTPLSRCQSVEPFSEMKGNSQAQIGNQQFSKKTVTLNEGKNAKISLSVKGNPVPEVTWFKDGVKIKTGNRYSLLSSKIHHQLKISKVCGADQGIYSIVASNVEGLFTTMLQIFVKGKEEPLVFLNSQQSVVAANEGADAALQCLLQKGLEDESATWLKGGQNLDETSGKYEMTSEGALRQLTIKSVTSLDSGEYRCKVNNEDISTYLNVCSSRRSEVAKSEKEDEDEDSVDTAKSGDNREKLKEIRDSDEDNHNKHQLKVLSKDTPSAMRVSETGTLIIHHQLSGDASDYLWELNGKKLANNDRCQIQSSSSKCTMILTDVSCHDAGDVVFKVPGTDICVPTKLIVEDLPPVPQTFDAKLEGDSSVRLSWQLGVCCDTTDYIIEMHSDDVTGWKEIGKVRSSIGNFLAEELKPGFAYKFRLKAHNSTGGIRTSDATSEIRLPQKLEIIQRINDVEIEEGNTARFSVQLNQAEVEGSWFMNGLQLKPRDEFCQIFSSGNVHSLHMKNLTQTGSATILFKTDHQLEAVGRLIVKSKPVYVVEGLKSLTVSEDSDAIFTLALSKSVPRRGSWFMNDVEIEESNDVIIESCSEYQTLHLKKLKVETSGKIEFNLPDEPQATSVAMLEVAPLPGVKSSQGILSQLPVITSVKTGCDVTISFKVSSNLLSPQWKVNGASISKTNEKYTLKQYPGEVQLVIRDVNHEDAGSILCVVGKSQTETTLKVESPEEIAFCDRDLSASSPNDVHFLTPKENYLEILEGQRDLQLKCELVNYKGEAEWLKDGIPVSTNDKNFQILSDGNTRVLMINDVTANHTGRYECVIADSSMKKQQFFDVAVKDEEDCKIAEINLIEGDRDAMLTCQLCHDDVEVAWQKDGVSIQQDTNHKIIKDGCVRQLIVTDVTPDVAGQYTCVIKHNGKTKKFDVTVEEIGFVEDVKDHTKELMEGDRDVKLTCKLLHNDVIINWGKNGNSIDPNDKNIKISESRNKRELTFDLVDLDVAGQYDCVIRRGSTMKKKSIDVIVMKQQPKVEIVEGLKDVECFVDEEVVVGIKLLGEPTVTTWMRNDEELEGGNVIQIHEGLQHHNIKLNTSSSRCSGEITFVADDVKETADIKVKELQFVESGNNPSHEKCRHFSEGDNDVRLTAKLPHSNVIVEWRKDGIPIDMKDKNIKVQEDGCERHLIFHDVNYDATGIYDCIIMSGNKRRAKSFQVFVKERLHTFEESLQSSVTVTEGDLLTLQTKVEPSHAEVRWLKNGVIMMSQSETRIKIIDEVGPIRSLVINDVTLGDCGVYSCETLHDVCSAEVKVCEIPVEVLEHLEDKECEEEDTVTFQIRLSQQPKHSPEWRINEKVLSTSDNCQISCYELLYSATLRNVTSSDQGKITFQAGNITETSHLVVKKPVAKFLKRLSDESICYLGNETVLICEVADKSAPVSWFKGDTLLRRKDKFLQTRDNGICKLRISDLEEGDGGMYHCRSDADDTWCKVIVEKPEIKVMEGLGDVTVNEGEKASFAVRLSQPGLDVVWMKNGRIVKERYNKCEIRSEGCWYAMHIRKLSTADSGEVKLVYDNEALDYALLQVKKPPARFIKELLDVVVELKDHVEFTCEISDPLEDVTWYRNDQECDEINSYSLEVVSKGVIRKLIISRVFMHHEATYSCVTGDGIRTSAELFVKVPPVNIEKPLCDVRAYVGSDVEFELIISDAEVEGRWMLDSSVLDAGGDKKGVEIQSNGRTRLLKLRNVEESSVITYVVDKNVTSSCRLDVRERPVAIERRLSDLSISEGNCAKFECFFSKAELPVVWYIDDDVIEPCEKYQVESDGCKHTLKVLDVRYDDEANYSCRYKHRRTSAELTVLEPRVDVIVHMTDGSFYEGETCILECVLSKPVAMVTWCKDGRAMMGVNSYVIENEDCVKHQLKIDQLTRASSGVYSLMYLNKTLTSAQVQVKRRELVIIQPLLDMTIGDDVTNVTLKCKFSRIPGKVVWLKNGEKLRQDPPNVYIESEGVTQHLTLQLNSTCIISCTVPDLCETTCEITVQPLSLNIVEDLPSTAVVIEGDDQILRCRFSKQISAHDVTWKINDVSLDATDRLDIEVTVKHEGLLTSLTLYNVSRRHDNTQITVECQGKKSCCTLRVFSPPDEPYNLRMIDNDNEVVLQWNKPLNSGGKPILDYVVFYKFLDDWDNLACDISTTNNYVYMTSPLHHLTPGITYLFRVAAVNEIGVGKFSNFDRMFTPVLPLSFDRKLNDVSISEGDSLELWCELTRPTTVETTWTINDVTLEADENRICIYNYDAIKELVIEPADVSDSGVYKCIVGNTSTSCVVNVLSKPMRFVRELEEFIESNEKEDITLSCVLTKRASQVVWIKDNLELEECHKYVLTDDDLTKSLTILSCDVSDRGLYACCVTGEHGDVITTRSSVQILEQEQSIPDDKLDASFESETGIYSHDDIMISGDTNEIHHDDNIMMLEKSDMILNDGGSDHEEVEVHTHRVTNGSDESDDDESDITVDVTVVDDGNYEIEHHSEVVWSKNESDVARVKMDDQTNNDFLAVDDSITEYLQNEQLKQEHCEDLQFQSGTDVEDNSEQTTENKIFSSLDNNYVQQIETVDNLCREEDDVMMEHQKLIEENFSDHSIGDFLSSNNAKISCKSPTTTSQRSQSFDDSYEEALDVGNQNISNESTSDEKDVAMNDTFALFAKVSHNDSDLQVTYSATLNEDQDSNQRGNSVMRKGRLFEEEQDAVANVENSSSVEDDTVLFDIQQATASTKENDDEILLCKNDVISSASNSEDSFIFDINLASKNICDENQSTNINLAPAHTITDDSLKSDEEHEKDRSLRQISEHVLTEYSNVEDSVFIDFSSSKFSPDKTNDEQSFELNITKSDLLQTTVVSQTGETSFSTFHETLSNDDPREHEDAAPRELDNVLDHEDKASISNYFEDYCNNLQPFPNVASPIQPDNQANTSRCDISKYSVLSQTSEKESDIDQSKESSFVIDLVHHQADLPYSPELLMSQQIETNKSTPEKNSEGIEFSLPPPHLTGIGDKVTLHQDELGLTELNETSEIAKQSSSDHHIKDETCEFSIKLNDETSFSSLCRNEDKSKLISENEISQSIETSSINLKALHDDTVTSLEEEEDLTESCLEKVSNDFTAAESNDTHLTTSNNGKSDSVISQEQECEETSSTSEELILDFSRLNTPPPHGFATQESINFVCSNDSSASLISPVPYLSSSRNTSSDQLSQMTSFGVQEEFNQTKSNVTITTQNEISVSDAEKDSNLSCTDSRLDESGSENNDLESLECKQISIALNEQNDVLEGKESANNLTQFVTNHSNTELQIKDTNKKDEHHEISLQDKSHVSSFANEYEVSFLDLKIDQTNRGRSDKDCFEIISESYTGHDQEFVIVDKDNDTFKLKEDEGFMIVGAIEVSENNKNKPSLEAFQKFDDVAAEEIKEENDVHFVLPTAYSHDSVELSQETTSNQSNQNVRKKQDEAEECTKEGIANIVQIDNCDAKQSMHSEVMEQENNSALFDLVPCDVSKSKKLNSENIIATTSTEYNPDIDRTSTSPNEIAKTVESEIQFTLVDINVEFDSANSLTNDEIPSINPHYLSKERKSLGSIFSDVYETAAESLQTDEDSYVTVSSQTNTLDEIEKLDTEKEEPNQSSELREDEIERFWSQQTQETNDFLLDFQKDVEKERKDNEDDSESLCTVSSLGSSKKSIDLPKPSSNQFCLSTFSQEGFYPTGCDTDDDKTPIPAPDIIDGTLIDEDNTLANYFKMKNDFFTENNAKSSEDLDLEDISESNKVQTKDYGCSKTSCFDNKLERDLDSEDSKIISKHLSSDLKNETAIDSPNMKATDTDRNISPPVGECFTDLLLPRETSDEKIARLFGENLSFGDDATMMQIDDNKVEGKENQQSQAGVSIVKHEIDKPNETSHSWQTTKHQVNITREKDSPLKIHVFESIVIRESCSTSIESDADTNDASSISARPVSCQTKRRQIVVKRSSSRPATSASFLSEHETDSDCEEIISSSLDLYYSVVDVKAQDSACIDLHCGQAVELLDSSSKLEWLVRSKPTKDQPIKLGFVDPVYLTKRVFTPSPSSLNHPTDAALVSTEEKLQIQKEEDEINPEDYLSSDSYLVDFKNFGENVENDELSFMDQLICEEEIFIDNLQKALKVLFETSSVPPEVDSNFQELFGDLEGIEEFHRKVLLPEIKLIHQHPHLFPHIILKHSHIFEQLHLSHMINTCGSDWLVAENDVIALELSELSQQAGTNMAEIAQKPWQQLVLYQYYLKKLICRKQTPIELIQVVKYAISMLAGIQYKENTARWWQRLIHRPENVESFGSLLKQGIFQLICLDERGFELKRSLRRIFLFEKHIVLANLQQSNSNSLFKDECCFKEAYMITDLSLVKEPVGADVKTFELKIAADIQKVAPTSLTLRCKSASAKKIWCRVLERVIHRAKSTKQDDAICFTTQLHDITVKLGDPLVLFCYVTSHSPPHPMEWWKDDQLLGSDDHVTLTGHDVYHSLIINHVTCDDIGVYRCASESDIRLQTSCVVTVVTDLTSS